MAQNFNLFGEPVSDHHGEKGRPEFIATDEKRNKVMVLLAHGLTQAEIAKAMGISHPTLKKYFVSELDQRKSALQRLKAAHASMVFELAASGNASGIKQLSAMIEKIEMQGAEKSLKAKPKKMRPLGKKEQAKLDAESAGLGSSWGDDLNPTTH